MTPDISSGPTYFWNKCVNMIKKIKGKHIFILYFSSQFLTYEQSWSLFTIIDYACKTKYIGENARPQKFSSIKKHVCKAWIMHINFILNIISLFLYIKYYHVYYYFLKNGVDNPTSCTFLKVYP